MIQEMVSRMIVPCHGLNHLKVVAGINPDRPLGTIRQVFQCSVRPEPVEGPVLSLLVVRSFDRLRTGGAHHERPKERCGKNLSMPAPGSCTHRLRGREQGIAIITVILIVALASSMAAFMAWQQQIWVRQVENLRDQAQAQAVARSSIDWARAVLADDASKNSVDHLGEKWATVLAPLPVGNGQVSGGVADQQGLFNLNNLVRNGKVSQRDLAVFKRLLQLLDLPTDVANAMVDWMDSDTEITSPGGAEDASYLANDPPHRAANQLMTEISNLYRIKGVDRDMVERLRPYVTALPEPTPVNVNTAPTEVLAALFQDLTLEEAKALIDERKSGYFRDQGDFRAHLPATKVGQINDNDFSVSSRYFMVTSLASFGRANAGYKALLARQGAEWPVVVWKKGYP